MGNVQYINSKYIVHCTDKSSVKAVPLLVTERTAIAVLGIPSIVKELTVARHLVVVLVVGIVGRTIVYMFVIEAGWVEPAIKQSSIIRSCL